MATSAQRTTLPVNSHLLVWLIIDLEMVGNRSRLIVEVLHYLRAKLIVSQIRVSHVRPTFLYISMNKNLNVQCIDGILIVIHCYNTTSYISKKMIKLVLALHPAII